MLVDHGHLQMQSRLHHAASPWLDILQLGPGPWQTGLHLHKQAPAPQQQHHQEASTLVSITARCSDLQPCTDCPALEHQNFVEQLVARGPALARALLGHGSRTLTTWEQ